MTGPYLLLQLHAAHANAVPAFKSMSLCTCPLATPSDKVTLLQVLESPNDSHPWIRFMAFHVELGEVAKARAVAEKALQTIHFRRALLDAIWMAAYSLRWSV